MQENNKLWLEIKEMFETSQTGVTIFNGAGSYSAKICDMLRITSASAMGAVMLNTSGVVFDDWIRLYGGDTSDRVGISKINLLSKNGTPERVKQMLIVATDVVGGIFAINSGKFDEGIGDVWYFAPDTLDWEDLETATRTASQPRRTRRSIWTSVASTSRVSVLVMLCTITGAPPPMASLPSLMPRLIRFSCMADLEKIGLQQKCRQCLMLFQQASQVL